MQKLKVRVREDGEEEEEEMQAMIKEDGGETKWCESWKTREDLNRNKNNDAKYRVEDQDVFHLNILRISL